MRCLFLCSVVSILLSFFFTASATTWLVPSEAPTIQAGIDSCAYGDTVLVACGTYYEHGIQLKSNMHLVSETGRADCVTINAQSLDRVFSCNMVQGTSVVGFTISGGFAMATGSGGGMACTTECDLDISYCNFTDNTASASGGGLYLEEGTLRLDNCSITENNAGSGGGGGIECDSAPCSIWLVDCEVALNQSEEGGGMRCVTTSVTLTDCTFFDNEAIAAGGGIALFDCSIMSIDGCTFDSNWCEGSGGGIFAESGGTELDVDSSIFRFNSSDDGYGGGICAGANASVNYCTFYGNGAAHGGDAVYSYLDTDIDNTIIMACTESEPVHCGGSGSVAITCSDVYGNAAGDWVGCIAGQEGINHNISIDPMFCDEAGGNYKLFVSSQCAGGACGQIGAHGIGCYSRIWSVPSDAPTIQAAIDSTTYGDTVIVDCGTYNEYEIRMKTGVNLQSQTQEPDCVTIDGGGGDGPIIICDGIHQASIDGFTITGGWGEDRGAGFVCMNSPGVWLTNCRITGNVCVYEGGGVASLYSDLHISNCEIDGNSGVGGGGGFFLNANTWISSSVVSDNFSDVYAAGGLYVDGGQFQMATTTLVRNETASQDGGGALFFSDITNPTVSSCTFTENDGYVGSAILVSNSALSVYNSIFAFSSHGDAIWCQNGGSATLSCCDVYGNDGDWVGCIAGQNGVNGNISLDPLFCSAESEFSLRPCSPCAPDNTGACGLIGANAVGDCGRIWSVPTQVSTIQAAINAATCGDTVEVACGTYYEHDIILKPEVYLRSETGLADCVTIDAEGLGNGLYSDLVNDVTIEGFTITGGVGFEGGGAVCNNSDNMVFKNCTFLNNSANYAGGLRGNNSEVSVEYCTFDGNTTTGFGGGVYFNLGSVALIGSEFTNNHSDAVGGGLAIDGGVTSIVTDCVFAENTSGNGGGLFSNGGNGQFTNCIFSNNSASNPYESGAAAILNSGDNLTNCTFYGNSSPSGGGQIITSGYITLDNTIIAFSPDTQAIYCTGGGSATLTCSDVYGNAGGDWIGCLSGQEGIPGNFSADPSFCNASAGDLHLRDCSPCAPDNSGGCGLIGALDVGPFTPRIWNVPADAPTIQAGIDSSACSDTVVVACGVYLEHNIVMKSGITLRSETGLAECVTIDAEGLGRGLWFDGINDVHVMGITITDGNAGPGGGVYCSLSDNLLFTNCVFQGNNSTGQGGGMYCTNNDMSFENCIFENNVSVSGGAGLMVLLGHCAFNNCAFRDNQSGCNGGGLRSVNCQSLELTGCEFTANTAECNGGGVFSEILTDDMAQFADCIFSQNQANVASYNGGGAYLSGEGTCQFTSCTFYGNETYPPGGTIGLNQTTVLLDNTIIAFSGTVSSGDNAVVCDGSGSATLTCCNLFGNGGDWVGCIAGQEGSNSNFSEDPRFCSASTGDFSLHESSPCAPDNNPGCGLIGALPVGCSSSIYLINPEGTGDYPTIQAAIDDANYGDVIELTDGTFTGAGNVDLWYGGKAVTVRSQSGDAANCIIDCDGASRGVSFEDGERASSILQDLTIANGSDVNAAGISCTYSAPSISGCVIYNCVTTSGYGGIRIYNNGFPPYTQLSNCTFSGNSSPTHRATIYCAYSEATFTNVIVAHNGGPSIDCVSSSPVMTCCDFYDNTGGDWADCIAGQEGINGNFSENPLFCDLASGDLHLYAQSPCAPGGGCGLIGALGTGCGFELTSIADIGNDQGRNVRVSWSRQFHDAPENEHTVTSYGLWRRVDEYLLKAETEQKLDLFSGREYPPGEWVCVMNVPASGEETYATETHTVCDSTADEGICWSVFFVRAYTDDPFTYFDCPPDSGYSVDNLYPEIPLGLLANYEGGAVNLTWTANVEGDLNYYSIYRGTEEGFEPDVPIGYSITPAYSDSDLPETWEFWYKVTATDFSGNESDPSLSAHVDASSAPEGALIPAAFYLGAATPDPFDNGTNIDYGIPAGRSSERVVLKIFDTTGRLVRTLVDADREPGVYRVAWDGSNQNGASAASGVYYYRITWGGKTETRRMISLK